MPPRMKSEAVTGKKQNWNRLTTGRERERERESKSLVLLSAGMS
jgi:hypothetical protein